VLLLNAVGRSTMFLPPQWRGWGMEVNVRLLPLHDDKFFIGDLPIRAEYFACGCMRLSIWRELYVNLTRDLAISHEGCA